MKYSNSSDTCEHNTQQVAKKPMIWEPDRTSRLNCKPGMTPIRFYAIVEIVKESAKTDQYRQTR